MAIEFGEKDIVDVTDATDVNLDFQNSNNQKMVMENFNTILETVKKNGFIKYGNIEITANNGIVFIKEGDNNIFKTLGTRNLSGFGKTVYYAEVAEEENGSAGRYLTDIIDANTSGPNFLEVVKEIEKIHGYVSGYETYLAQQRKKNYIKETEEKEKDDPATLYENLNNSKLWDA